MTGRAWGGAWPAAAVARLACAAAAGWLPTALLAAPAPDLSPLVGATGASPLAPWAYAGLPAQKPPATRYTAAEVDGQRALRVEAAGSYGNLVHPLAGARAGLLSWRWRVDQALAGVDLRTRQGDDTALKVCAMFDLPRAQLPFVERQLMRLAESRTGGPLPNATLCYVWDATLPRGTVVPNAYSRRVRYITLGAAGPVWQTERQDLAADFMLAFGDESRTVPALLAIAVGADADNTGGRSLGWLADLQHRAASSAP